MTGKSSYEVTAADIEAYVEKQASCTSFKVQEIALFTTIDLLAKTLSKCRFCTVENGKEVEKSEFYAWNYAPNKHQTKTEFLTEAVFHLIFNNEVLIFETANGQRLVADSFGREERALYDDIFTNVSARGWTSPRTYYSSEVIYLKYSNFAVRSLLAQMCASYERLMTTAEQKYNRSNERKAILNISTLAQSDPAFNKKFDEIMNKHFKAFFSSDKAVLPMYDGYGYQDVSTAEGRKATDNEVNDISKLRNEAVSTFANALHIPPAIIRGEASQLKDATDSFISNAIDPIARIFEQGITVGCYGERGVLSGSYLHIDTTYAKHLDPISSADKADKSIADSILSRSQAQQYLGMIPDDDPAARAHYITKNYKTADLAVTEGGEKNA